MTFPWTEKQWHQWYQTETARIIAKRQTEKAKRQTEKAKHQTEKPKDRPDSAPSPPKTTPWLRWSKQELAVIRTFLNNLKGSRPPHGYSHTLTPQLPGRSLQDIRNAFNVMCRKLARICNCGASLLPCKATTTRCPSCAQVSKNLRAERLRNALCAQCGSPLAVKGSSTTLCPSCRTRRQNHRPKDLSRFKQTSTPRHSKTGPLACHKIIPWPACGHSRFIAQLVASEAPRPVIDLFGGTGELLRLVAAYKGHPYAYFDLDPRIANLVAYAVQYQPLTPEANELIHSPKAITLAIRQRRLQLLGNTLRPTLRICECKDALNVLAHPEHMPHNAIFLADPPWPGTHWPHPSPGLWHTIDHRHLIEALLDLPQEQDFVLSLGAERIAAELAAKYLCKATLFWRTSGPYSAKSLLALSPGLSTLHPELRKQTINLDKYGCLPTPHSPSKAKKTSAAISHRTKSSTCIATRRP